MPPLDFVNESELSPTAKRMLIDYSITCSAFVDTSVQALLE
jgi:hypothetical protein